MNERFDYIMSRETLKIETFRYDFVLSNWIFAWFLLYYFGIVPFSPLLAILVGFVCNTYEFLSKQKDESLSWRIDYIWWNMIIKMMPALIILVSRNNQIKWKQDVIVILGLYGLFLVWVFINGKVSPSHKAMNPFNFNAKDKNL